MEQTKYYLGIDPGKQGALTVLNQWGTIIETIGTPLIGKDYDKQEIRNFLLKYKYNHVGLENPNVIFGVGKSAVASLMHCVGLFEGILMGLQIPHTLVKPQEWQKECWKHVTKQKKADGKSDPKATSILAAINIWSSWDFKITNKGGKSKNYNDGMIDAALIGEYVRRLYSGEKK